MQRNDCRGICLQMTKVAYAVGCKKEGTRTRGRCETKGKVTDMQGYVNPEGSQGHDLGGPCASPLAGKLAFCISSCGQANSYSIGVTNHVSLQSWRLRLRGNGHLEYSSTGISWHDF